VVRRGRVADERRSSGCRTCRSGCRPSRCGAGPTTRRRTWCGTGCSPTPPSPAASHGRPGGCSPRAVLRRRSSRARGSNRRLRESARRSSGSCRSDWRESRRRRREALRHREPRHTSAARVGGTAFGHRSRGSCSCGYDLRCSIAQSIMSGIVVRTSGSAPHRTAAWYSSSLTSMYFAAELEPRFVTLARRRVRAAGTPRPAGNQGRIR